MNVDWYMNMDVYEDVDVDSSWVWIYINKYMDRGWDIYINSNWDICKGRIRDKGRGWVGIY